jgi:DNA repair exonuclease SbcCD ATPase subunit
VIRYFIILLETLALIYILISNEEFNQLIKRLSNAIPASSELKTAVLKGVTFGAYFLLIITGIIIVLVLLYYLIPFIKTILSKEELIDSWYEEFQEEIASERKEVQNLKAQAQTELQQARKIKAEVQRELQKYKKLQIELQQKEIELEMEFEAKRNRYLQELSGLQNKNREFQARIKRLKEQLKSCREKLKKRDLA